MSDKIHDAKGKLRKLAKAKRSEVHSVKSERVAQKRLVEYICKQITNTKHVASYCPIQSEISPMGAIKKLVTLGYSICLPVVCQKNQPLKFRTWQVNENLIEGDFGVSIPSSGDWVIPGLIIVPLLAFDKMGFRLGYGGGYYDRTLVQLKKKNNVKAVGFAFSGQYCPNIPTDDYDYKLDSVITEQGITEFE